MLPVINCGVGAYFAFMSFPGHMFYLFHTYKFEIKYCKTYWDRPPTIFSRFNSAGRSLLVKGDSSVFQTRVVKYFFSEFYQIMPCIMFADN